MKKVQKITSNKSILHKLSCVMTVFMLIQIIAVYSPVMAEEVNPPSIVAIGGTKVVEGEAPNGTFTFTLTQVTDASGSDYTSSGITRNTTVSTQAQSMGEKKYTFIFDDMQLANGDYYFEIKETDNPGWTSSDQPYIIYVKVLNGLVTIVNAEDLPIPPNTDVNDLTWISPGVHPNLPWGSANYFSVLTFGNFTVPGADVESGLAVGGNLITKGGYSVGKTKDGLYAGHPIAPHNPRLLLKGNISAANTLTVYGGSAVLSDNSTGDTEKIYTRKYIGSSPFYEPGAIAENNYETFASSVQGFTPASYTTISKFFSDAYDDMKNLSAYYAGLQNGNRIIVVPVVATANKHPAYVYNGTSITTIFFDESTNMGGNPGAKGAFPLLPGEYGEYDTIVYNLILNDFTGSVAQISSSQFTIPEEYKGNIIINVIPGSNINTLNINGGDMYINRIGNEGNGSKLRDNARNYSDRIIWNFPSTNLTKITITSQEIIGSVLAPYADFIANGGGVNGTLVAKSVDATGETGASTGGWETHSTTYFGRVQVNTNKIEFTNTYGTIPTPGDNSITVHKYIVDSLESYTTPGDGRELNETQLANLPSTKLDGITFTLYSIDSPTDIPSEYTTIEVDTVDKKLYLDSNKTYNLTLVKSETTANGGIATFDKLENGYYVVVEEPNAKVEKPIIPFIVQLPLYSKDVSGLKDVHVYPKNLSKKGGDKFPDTGGIGSVIFTVTGVVMLSGSLVALTLADKKSKSGRAKK